MISQGNELNNANIGKILETAVKERNDADALVIPTAAEDE